MDSMPAEPCSVYRYYDESDLLIYVGITSRGIRRNREHNATKTWWQFVARQEVDHYPTRAEALKREAELVQTYSPPFNTQHNKDHRKMREAYLLFASARAQPTSWQEEIKAAGMRLPLDYHEFGDAKNVVLRTRIEDAGMASAILLDPEDERPRVIGMRKVGTSVLDIDRVGPIVLFRLSTTRQHPLFDSWVFVKFDKKMRHLHVKHITTRMDHGDASKCNKRCPDWTRREVRWVRPDDSGRSIA